MYYVGQKVLCVNDGRHEPIKGKIAPVVTGDIYTVHNITECHCGTVLLDVGFVLYSGMRGLCIICQKRTLVVNGPWWLLASRFIPLDDILEEIEESEEMSVDILSVQKPKRIKVPQEESIV